MSLSKQAQAKLDLVKQSPIAVAAKDRTAWVALFSDIASIEDPVGSKPNISGLYDPRSGRVGRGVVERFFDTFIAPNTIEFDVRQDLVAGNHVVRDLMINITMAPRVKVQVPMHLLYELQDEADGGYSICRLAAHWEFLPMIKQLLGLGMPAMSVLWGLTVRMLSIQGMGGALGFSQAAFNVGEKGRKTAMDVAATYNADDELHFVQLFAPANQGIYFSDQGKEQHYSVLDFCRSINGRLSFEKSLVAGHCVSATVSWQAPEGEKTGVVIFEFDRKQGLITQARFYLA